MIAGVIIPVVVKGLAKASDKSSFAVNLLLREKLNNAVIYLENVNSDYYRYITSLDKAKDEQKGIPDLVSFNPGQTIRSLEN